MREYPILHLDTNEMNMKSIQYYTQTQMKVKKQLVRRDINVTEHERLSNITLRHKYK